MPADYVFRTFTTETEATYVRNRLKENYSGEIALEWSDFTERFVLKCKQDDSRALYYRSQHISPSGL